jgi:hypothetical protein
VLHDNYKTLYFELYNNYETLYFELYNKYKTSCMINYDCQSLEPVLSLHDICMIFTNFALLSYNMCDKSMFFECQKKVTKICNVCYKIIYFAFVLSSDDKCIAYECSYRNCSMVYQKKKELEFVFPLYLNCTICNRHQKRSKTRKLKHETQVYH